MARNLNIGPGLSLSAEEFVEARTAILGQSGRGKSGLLKRIEEELVRLDLPFVAFDPAGVAWGIRSSADGKGPGLPCLVIGGKHGDLPLNRKAGAEVATAIVEANVSVIIDFSDEPKAAYREFLRDFCDRLYAVSAESKSPRLVIIDEAKEVVPQVIRPDLAPTYDAVERLVRQGRNRGIGVCLVSQRAATVNKDVLTQCGSLFVFGLVGTPDRKAVREWVSAWGSDEQLAKFEAGLAALERREAWFWSPQEFGKFQRVRVGDFATFHPDRTHLRREGLLRIIPATADISTVIGKLGVVMEKLREAKADVASVPVLRARIRELERSLAAPKPPSGPTKAETAAIIRSAVAPLRRENDDLRKALVRANVTILRVVSDGRGFWERLANIVPVPLPVAVAGSAAGPVPKRGDGEQRDESVSSVHLPVAPKATATSSPEDGDARPRPTGGALRMLRVLSALHPKALERTDLAVLAEIGPYTGTFSDYLSMLRRAGYLEDAPSGRIMASDVGCSYFEARPVVPLAEEVAESAKRRVSGGARRMLAELIAQYPGSMPRAELADRAGIAVASGTFSDYLSLLRRLGFIEDGDDRSIVARGVLTMDGI